MSQGTVITKTEGSVPGHWNTRFLLWSYLPVIFGETQGISYVAKGFADLLLLTVI